jgi:DNA-binding transcriptional MocR family regulator
MEIDQKRLGKQARLSSIKSQLDFVNYTIETMMAAPQTMIEDGVKSNKEYKLTLEKAYNDLKAEIDLENEVPEDDPGQD